MYERESSQTAFIGFEKNYFQSINLIIMLTVKLICKKSKARKDGTSVVFIQYCFDSNRRTLLNTGIAIPSNYGMKEF